MIDAINQAIASLHPSLSGVDVVQLVSIGLLSWLGGRVITHDPHVCNSCKRCESAHRS